MVLNMAPVRAIRLRRWFVLVAAVVFLYTIEVSLIRKDGSSPGRRLKDWGCGPNHMEYPAARQQREQVPLITGQGDFHRETVMPSARGRVLVTGGGGMIGKRVVRRFLQANIPVTVLDTIFFQDEEDVIKHDFPRGDLRVVRGDLREASALQDAMSEVKGVIHLAAVSRVLWCLENLKDCTDINVRGTELVIDALKGGWFIQASSREVYGKTETLPVAEDAARSPANVYGKSKAEAEDVITTHVQKVTDDGSKHLKAIMLRLSNVYGSTKDHPERLIPAIVRNALSNRPIQMVGGDQDLDMVFVEDAVDAISLAVTRLDRKSNGWVGSSKGTVEVFNVGTSSSTSAMSLIQKTLWVTNSSSPLRIIPGDDRFPSRYVGSTAKASTVLGYKARVSIDEGLYRLALDTLQETVDYLKDKRESEPFECTRTKQYTINDLLALDGCSGLVAERDNHGEITYSRIRDSKDGNFNEFYSGEEPAVWNFDIKPAEEGAARVSFSISSPEVNHTLGIPAPLKGVASEFEFLARVEPSTGYINLCKMSGAPLYSDQKRKRSRMETGSVEDAAIESRADQVDYNYRITPTCCSDKPTPWPFFRDDAIASIILDYAEGDPKPFNSSQIGTICSRLQKAEQYATRRIRMLESFSLPIVLQEAPLPLGRAPDWRLRRYSEICTNLCDHPTFCVDTGSCKCVHAAQCAPRTRFPFGNVANMDTLSYPPPPKDAPGNDDALVQTLARSSWANIINQDANRYLGSHPEWPPMTSVLDPDDIEQIKKDNADKFWKLRNSGMGCFSADTAMELASRRISKPYQASKSLVFVPFYNVNDFTGGTTNPNSPAKFYDHAMTQLSLDRRVDIDPSDVIMPFTHDFGRCNSGSVLLNTVVHRVKYVEPTERERRITGWAPMGDMFTRCYYHDQDVVIPSRTCLEPKLRKTFGNVAQVKPIRQRQVLATFKGAPQFASRVIRSKFKCYRAMKPGKLEGGEKLETHWYRLRPGSDYLQTINNTVFCALPRGTTGWATRTADVIYAGCIPVIIGQETHHAFWDILDWSKFAVFINEWDIERLEDILLSYTWEQLEQMQANLMLARDAFLYSDEGAEEESLRERGPFWLAAHSTWLRKLTKYPT